MTTTNNRPNAPHQQAFLSRMSSIEMEIIDSWVLVSLRSCSWPYRKDYKDIARREGGGWVAGPMGPRSGRARHPRAWGAARSSNLMSLKKVRWPRRSKLKKIWLLADFPHKCCTFSPRGPGSRLAHPAPVAKIANQKWCQMRDLAELSTTLCLKPCGTKYFLIYPTFPLTA